MICKKCGSTMMVRINSKTGEKFYGCADYPNCKYTEPFEIFDIDEDEYEENYCIEDESV
jgi:ssDNA-binding Zn-finger/Zn-ribbon topoisomerase 1